MSAPSFQRKRFALLRMARRDSSVTLGPYKVLDAMLDAADRETGACFTGHTYLQAETALSTGGVRKAIDALKAAGWISIPRPTRGRGNANEYDFGFDKLADRMGTAAENCPDRDSFTEEKTAPSEAENCPETRVKLSRSGHSYKDTQQRTKGPPPAAPDGRVGGKVDRKDLSSSAATPVGASEDEDDDCPFPTAEEVHQERERLAALLADRGVGASLDGLEPRTITEDWYLLHAWLGRTVTTAMADKAGLPFVSERLDDLLMAATHAGDDRALGQEDHCLRMAEEEIDRRRTSAAGDVRRRATFSSRPQPASPESRHG